MALDEPSDDDEIFEQETFKVIVDKKLYDQLGGVRIDYGADWQGVGFTVKPINGSGESSCGSGGCC